MPKTLNREIVGPTAHQPDVLQRKSNETLNREADVPGAGLKFGDITTHVERTQ